MSFELKESTSDSYGPRTYYNAGYSDATIAFASNFNTMGEILTEKAAKGRYLAIDVGESYDPIIAARKIYSFLKKNNYKTLNIAGNGAQTFIQNGIDQKTLNLLIYQTLDLVHKHYPIKFIRSGGQTGADLAGAVFAKIKEINCTVTYPKHYRQRLYCGTDIIQSQQEALSTIELYEQALKSEVQETDAT